MQGAPELKNPKVKFSMLVLSNILNLKDLQGFSM